MLLLEHARSGGVEDVISELRLTVNVDRRCGFTGQEAVVDLSGALRELEEGHGRWEDRSKEKLKDEVMRQKGRRWRKTTNHHILVWRV